MIPDAARLVLEAAERGVPIRAERWTLHHEHEDIGQADMVVIDARDEKERAAAESLKQEIRRLRADPSVRLDLGLDFGRRRPGIYIADLSDPRKGKAWRSPLKNRTAIWWELGAGVLWP